MEKVTFDATLSLDENLEFVLKKAEEDDPELAKLLRSLMPILTSATLDDRKSARATFHKLSRDSLDKLLAKDARG